jgi:lipopolysaccharide export system permease protein
MLSILDKYIIKKFLGTFVFAIVLIISIAVVFDVNEQLDKFIRNDAPLKAIIFQYYVNFVPYYTNLFSALFVFISVIFFTSKLADNSEVIAMLASGVSFKRLLRPYLISATIIAISTFILGGFVIPPANVNRIEFQNRYIRNKKVDYANRVQMMVEPGVIAYIDRYNDNEKQGYSFSLDKFKKNELVSRLTAERIKYNSGFSWTVYNYNIRTMEGLHEKNSFGTQLDTTITIIPQDFVISANDAEQMTTPRLRSYIARQKLRGVGNIQDFEIEYYKRFASAFSAFILTVIGASLSSRKVKGGMGVNIGLGLLLSVSYILFMTISSTFSASGFVSPMIAVWVPNVIFSFIAWFLYKRAPN